MILKNLVKIELVFKNFSKNDLNSLSNKCRIYLEGSYVPGMTVELFENPPFEGEVMEEWLNRIFKGKKFLLLLNKSEL